MEATMPRERRTTNEGPRSLPVIISAWAVPVLVVGQFAVMAVIPVAIVLVAVLRNARLRALRGWVAALTATYALGLILWAIGPDRAPSLSKDLHPLHAGVISALGVAVAIAYHVNRRRHREAQ